MSELSENFIDVILKMASKGVYRSEISLIGLNFGVKRGEAGKYIKEAKKRGMYSVPGMSLYENDTYYQFDKSEK